MNTRLSEKQMTSNPCNWVTIKEGCLTAQTPITNDDAKKIRRNVQHGRYCVGENISKYHDINFVICIQPKHPNRGDTSPPPALSQIARS